MSLLILILLFALHVLAQSTTRPSLATALTLTTFTRSGGQDVPITTVIPLSLSSSLSPSPTPTLSPTPSPAPSPIILATTLDPAFGVLGAILILTGIPSAFWGHKNRWTSFFLIGFYTLSLICIVLILKFGVLPAVNPPSKKLRAMFVLSSAIAGVAGGGITIFFWKAAKFFIGAWGGFALGLYIQCFRNGGLVRSIALRWILYIACAVSGFILCTIPKLHYHILLISTAFVGATSFMIGVDCYTTAGLKEFYLWNLGFKSLFPKFTTNGIQFPISQIMQIELGIQAAVALMGIAIQFRILQVLQRKLREIAEEQRKRDEQAEANATARFASVLKERAEWEKEHPSLTHARNLSAHSNLPLIKDHDSSTSPTTDEHNSTFTLVNGHRSRHHSAISEFLAAPTPDEDLKRAIRNSQSPGALPALDLGFAIQEDVPRDFISQERTSSPSPKRDTPSAPFDELKRKEELIAEIQTIRRSIEALRSEAPSRRPSLSSATALQPGPSSSSPPHARPPRETDPRTRAYSMDLLTLASPQLDEPISRPTSAPLRDNDWDSYVRDRKLLQPPSGVTQPIPTAKLSVPPAVAEALSQRKRRESALERGEIGLESSSEDIPVANLLRSQHKKNHSSNIPLSILPPKAVLAPTPQRPTQPRTRTFEELSQRHREMMRDLQAPLSRAEKEHAEIEAARSRWERSKALEKEAVLKRQAEKAALIKEAEKKRKSDDEPDKGGRKSSTIHPGRHSRSLSVDKLATLGSASRRMSMLKVEDWQQYQQDLEMGVRAKRDSHAAGIPFPRDPRQRDANFERRKSGYSRDSPN